MEQELEIELEVAKLMQGSTDHKESLVKSQLIWRSYESVQMRTSLLVNKEQLLQNWVDV